ncbi:hypothetical protein ZWY2020_031602 [Hordeum vulgare]|nr:hypothetical protein ZWY2020_031602 [Hordeum vulgare]
MGSNDGINQRTATWSGGGESIHDQAAELPGGHGKPPRGLLPAPPGERRKLERQRGRGESSPGESWTAAPQGKRGPGSGTAAARRKAESPAWGGAAEALREPGTAEALGHVGLHWPKYNARSKWPGPGENAIPCILRQNNEGSAHPS